MANLSDSLHSQIRTIGRGPSKPAWWVLFQVGAASVVFVAMLWQMMSVDPTENRAISVRHSSPAVTSAASADPPHQTPATASGTTQVPSVEGGQVLVPQAALDAATLAFKGSGDIAAARTVPMASGETFPLPTQDFPKATIGKLQVSTHTDELVTFVATFDTDGKGPAAADYLPWTVIREGGTWVVTLRSE